MAWYDNPDEVKALSAWGRVPDGAHVLWNRSDKPFRHPEPEGVARRGDVARFRGLSHYRDDHLWIEFPWGLLSVPHRWVRLADSTVSRLRTGADGSGRRAAQVDSARDAVQTSVDDLVPATLTELLSVGVGANVVWIGPSRAVETCRRPFRLVRGHCVGLRAIDETAGRVVVGLDHERYANCRPSDVALAVTGTALDEADGPSIQDRPRTTRQGRRGG